MVIVQAGHVRIQQNCDAGLQGGTGAPGEIDWTPKVTDHCVWLLQQSGIGAQAVDANFNCSDAVKQDYDAVVAVHYQSDPPNESGFFVGVGNPQQDSNPTGSSSLQANIRSAYAAATGLQERGNWDSDNISFYYLFESLSGPTPFALIECGTGAPGAPDHDFLWNNIDKVGQAIAQGIANFLGRGLNVAPPPPTPAPTPTPAPAPTTQPSAVTDALAQLEAALAALKGALGA